MIVKEQDPAGGTGVGAGAVVHLVGQSEESAMGVGSNGFNQLGGKLLSPGIAPVQVGSAVDGEHRQGKDELQAFDGLDPGGLGVVGFPAGEGLDEAAEGHLAGAGAFLVYELAELAFERGGVGAAERHGGFIGFEEVAQGDLGAVLAGLEDLEEELLAGFVFGGEFHFAAQGGQDAAGLGAEVVTKKLDAAGLAGVGEGDDPVQEPEDAERCHDGGGGDGEELDGGERGGAGEEGMDEVGAGEQGCVGEDVAEFVADDAGEFAFVEEMEQASIDEDAVEGAHSGPEFAPDGVGIHVLGPDQVDGRGVGREAEGGEDLAGKADEGIAGMDAEPGVGADVLEALFVEEDAAGDEAEDAEGAEGEGQPGGPSGAFPAAGQPKRPKADGDGDFEAENPAAEGLRLGRIGG